MLSGLIKKDIKKAINDLIDEGFVKGVVDKVGKALRELPQETITLLLGNFSKYIDDITIDMDDKKVVIKFRKEF